MSVPVTSLQKQTQWWEIVQLIDRLIVWWFDWWLNCLIDCFTWLIVWWLTNSLTLAVQCSMAHNWLHQCNKCHRRRLVWGQMYSFLVMQGTTRRQAVQRGLASSVGRMAAGHLVAYSTKDKPDRANHRMGFRPKCLQAQRYFHRIVDRLSVSRQQSHHLGSHNQRLFRSHMATRMVCQRQCK